jgi:hypothetical protein
MKVKLTNLFRQASEGGLRTTSVVGDCENLPKTGKSFHMTGEALVPTEVKTIYEKHGFPIKRDITTSRVVDVKIEEGIFTFITESESLYSLEILEV